MKRPLETAIKLAIETYSKLSGMAVDDVKSECLKDTSVRKSVMMLSFASATMHEELQRSATQSKEASSSLHGFH